MAGEREFEAAAHRGTAERTDDGAAGLQAAIDRDNLRLIGTVRGSVALMRIIPT